MNLYSLLPLTGIVANLLLGFYIYYRIRKGLLSSMYLVLSLFLSVWAIGNFGMFTIPNPEIAFQVNQLAILGAIWVGPTFLHFVSIFIGTKFPRKPFHYVLLYLPALIISYYGLAFNLIADHVEPTYWGYVAPPPSFLYIVMQSMFLV